MKRKLFKYILLFTLVFFFTLSAKSALAAPAFVQGKTGVGSWNATALSTTFDANITSGNIIIISLKWGSPTVVLNSVTAGCVSGGFVLLSNSLAFTDIRVLNAYGIIDSNGPCTVTANISGAAGVLQSIMHEVSGIDTISPLDGNTMQLQNSPGFGSDAVSSGSITTTSNGDYIFGSSWNNSDVVYTQGSSFTLRNSISGYGGGVSESLVQSSAGSIVATFTQSVFWASPVSSIIAFRPSSGGITPPPPSLTLPIISLFSSSPSSIISGGSSTLSWSVSGNPTPSISISNIGTVTGTSVSVSPTQTTTYTLTATNSQGSVTANSTITVSSVPSDTTPPSIPTNLSASAVSTSQINLSWSVSTDNIGVTGYKIYRGGVQISTSASNSYSDSGLSPSTSYSYTVQAYDLAGNNSSQSAGASATTQAVTPPPSSGNYPWSGIIAPNRATDWSNAGAVVPTNWTQCGGTITAYTGSASAINTAIANCGFNQYVQLGAGTFNLNSGINFGSKSNVALRGAGANQTFLNFTGGGGCPIAGGTVCMGNSSSYIGLYFAPDNIASISNASLPQGTNQITISSIKGSSSNLAVGKYIAIDQCDSGTSGNSPSGGIGAGCGTGSVADNGEVYMCSTADASCPSASGEAGGNRPKRGQAQFVKITNINGNTITFTPGLYSSNWKSARSPEIFWATSPNSNLGLEDVSIDFTSAGTQSNVSITNCQNCWVKGLRSVYTTRSGGSQRDHVWIILSPKVTVRDSYFYGSASATSEGYGVETFQSGDVLIENNIAQNVPAPWLFNSDCQGCVVGYNFDVEHVGDGSNMWASHWLHANTSMTLAEGNIGTAYRSDYFHGSHAFATLFRNYYSGWEPGVTGYLVPIYINGISRYFNIIGNVLGKIGVQTTYQGTTGGNNEIYDIGFWSPNDSLTLTSIMRWGNYDTVNSATRWLASEVPSNFSDSTGNPSRYINLIPAGQTLPASFYYSSKPSWFGSLVWPPIGPDVSGGTVHGSNGTSAWAVQSVGGHANNTPALNCYKNIMNGPADGSGNALSFDANTCYSLGSNPPPPPTTPLLGDLNLDHTVNATDSSLLSSKWNQNYSAYDLNNDGIINSLDFALLKSNWGKTW